MSEALYQTQTFLESSEPFQIMCSIMYGAHPKDIEGFFDPADMVIETMGEMDPDLAKQILGDRLTPETMSPCNGLQLLWTIPHQEIMSLCSSKDDVSDVRMFVAGSLNFSLSKLAFASKVMVKMKDAKFDREVRIRIKIRGKDTLVG